MLEEWTFQQYRCESLKSSTPYLFVHWICNNDFNNATLMKLESLYWSTNTLDVKFFYIPRRLDKKFTIFCEANRTCYRGYFLTDFCLSFRNCGCTLTKNCIRVFKSWRRSRDVISQWYCTVWKYAGQGFCSRMSEKESSAGYSDARPLPLEMFPIGLSVKEHMQRVVKSLVTMSWWTAA